MPVRFLEEVVSTGGDNGQRTGKVVDEKIE
jgi:hypothetical protein